MAIRIPWDIYEAALLLDACMRIDAKEVSRNKAIRELSLLLRRKAINRGIIIDEIFRNENGISFQLAHIKKILTGNKNGLNSSAKIFTEIVNIYRYEPNRYQSILRDGIAMARGSDEVNLQEPFFQWLSRKVSGKMLSDLFIMCDDIERFCIEHDILNHPLFETTSLATLHKVKDIVETDKQFRSLYRGQLSRMSSAILYYINFVSEYVPNNLTQHESNSLRESAERKSETKSVAEITAQAEVKKPSNASGESLSTAKPKLYRVDFINYLKVNGAKASGIFPYINLVSQASNFAKEMDLSSQNIFSICSPDTIQNLIVLLLRNDDFRRRNRQQKRSPEMALRKYLEFCRAYEISSHEESKEICASENVQDTENASIESAANTVEIQTVSSNAEHTEPHIESSTTYEVSTEDRLNSVLENEFPDGLRPISLRLRKFRSAYAERYGEELALDDDNLHKQLLHAGTLIGDRIYARQQREEAGVMKEICSAIREVFANGATCVYLECVLNRFRDSLASEMSIYSAETLKSVLSNSLEDEYHFYNDYMFHGGTFVDLTVDIQTIMQESLRPLNYAEIHAKLWYIPLDKVKIQLVRIPTIANVDSETYFYAPNLPLTSDEMKSVTSAMRKEIDRRGFLVAKDIPELMKKYCPSAAMNTADFKDWGLRNIFKVLLADEFSFSGSIISEKGQNLDMQRVYRNYCAEREHLTIDELHEFSSEVGVQIYWDSVMHEMVRVSQRELVRQDLIHFDTEAIDAVLDKLCPGEFIPIHEIELFMQFPVAEVPWNGFVLESYLLNYSEHFVLWQASISDSSYYGVIARASAPYTSYRDVIIDVLAHSDKWQNEKSAMELLVKKGCQARRRFGNFGEVLKEARLRREELSAAK